MKKLLLAAVLCLAVSAAQAQTVTNPFFMPAKGAVLSDTSFGYDHLKNSDPSLNNYMLGEQLSYGLADNLQLGAGINYAIKHGGGHSITNFTNPNVFAYYRVISGAVNFDLGADVELGVFDNSVAQKDFAYNFVARLGAETEIASLGAKATYTINQFDDDAMDNYNNLGLYAFGLLHFGETLGLGVDLSYGFNALGEDNDYNPFSARVIGTLDVSENSGFFGYVGWQDQDVENEDSLKDLSDIVAGVQYKVFF